ncbi:MAG TPA: response regulator [Verrucomicrobiae bacterium]|nr:response regulator [Verrucomicrobiae bacterium]
MKQATQPIDVLIVEDDQSLNEAYWRILEAEHYSVERCYNGAEALEKLSKMQPRIILLDLKMPVMGGIEFLTKFSKLEPKHKPKIIIFSNYSQQAEVQDAFDLGATKYLLKAWASPKELVKLVQETIQSND